MGNAYCFPTFINLEIAFMASSDRVELTYTISEISRIVGLSQKRIRDYEKEGFLKPRREPETNNRIYIWNDISIIQRLKDLIHQQGFTISCLKNLMAAAPCWIIFGCSMDRKESCSVYLAPGSKCYDIRPETGCASERSCETCPIFLNRNHRPAQIF